MCSKNMLEPFSGDDNVPACRAFRFLARKGESVYRRFVETGRTGRQARTLLHCVRIQEQTTASSDWLPTAQARL